MAPSSGHLLVPKIMGIVRFGITQSKAFIKSKLPGSAPTTSTTGQYTLQPIRVYAQNQPTHPLAYLKQSRSHNARGFSTAARSLNSPVKPPGRVPYDRSKFPVSRTSKAISQRGAAPFASTLRPNLTGGALPRSAGGYGLSGAGARHFSHTSGAQAQVIHNVSAGIRAFCIGGGMARFDGVDPVTGEKRFRAVSRTENVVQTQEKSPLARITRGTSLQFKLSKAITTPPASLASAFHEQNAEIASLNDIDLLDDSAADFARALSDFAAVSADLRRLSAFGDLPVSLTTTSSGPVYSVHFAGCDADLVTCLCDEVGVRRCVIVEDEAWMNEKDVEMALLFPFAPTCDIKAVNEFHVDGQYFEKMPLDQHHQPDELDWRHMLSPSVQPPSRSESLQSFPTLHSPDQKANLPSGYESLEEGDFASEDPFYRQFSPVKTPTHSTANSVSADYEGLEGIYKFLQECDEARR